MGVKMNLKAMTLKIKMKTLFNNSLKVYPLKIGLKEIVNQVYYTIHSNTWSDCQANALIVGVSTG